MVYNVYWADKKVKKVFDLLPASIQSRIGQAIQLLSSHPRPSGVKKLAGKLKGAWRMRIGDYRLLYDIDDQTKKVILLDLGHRKQIYR